MWPKDLRRRVSRQKALHSWVSSHCPPLYLRDACSVITVTWSRLLRSSQDMMGSKESGIRRPWYPGRRHHYLCSNCQSLWGKCVYKQKSRQGDCCARLDSLLIRGQFAKFQSKSKKPQTGQTLPRAIQGKGTWPGIGTDACSIGQHPRRSLVSKHRVQSPVALTSLLMYTQSSMWRLLPDSPPSQLTLISSTTASTTACQTLEHETRSIFLFVCFMGFKKCQKCQIY